MSRGGVALPTGERYGPYRVPLSALWVNVADSVGDAAAQWDAGKVPFLHPMFHHSRQPDATMPNVAAGLFDPTLRQWIDRLAAYCATGRKAAVAYLPEFNGNWTVYGQEQPVNRNAFIDAYRQFVQMGRDAGLTREQVLWCWAPNATGWPDDELAWWWPGDDVVDVCGLSAYCWGGLYPGAEWLWPDQAVAPYVDEIRAFTDRRVVVTQTGAGYADADSPEWLDRLAAYGAAADVDWIWFNINEFAYAPGADDFNARTATLDNSPPYEWFTKEEPVMGLYPGSITGKKATTYGPLPTHGHTKVALVLHTTETAGMPGFSEGDVAPHYVYAPRTRTWTKMAEYEDGYVGTLKGHTYGGHGNCKAFQVEILCYSDSTKGAPWVGNLTDENYQDLADFYRWARDRYGIGDMVTPTPAGGWRAGASSPYRLSDSEWGDFDGLTAHGAVPLNTHWDTGVLDLQRVYDLAVASYRNLGRGIEYVQEGDEGMAVEEAQVKIIMAKKGIAFYGTSNRTFVEAEAPTLEFKRWDAELTRYFSEWTGRNSYGYGPTEKIMVEEAIRKLTT